MEVGTFKKRNGHTRRTAEEEGNGFEKQFRSRRIALKLKGRKLREKLLPAGHFAFKPHKCKEKKRPSGVYDFWKADYDTIKLMGT